MAKIAKDTLCHGYGHDAGEAARLCAMRTMGKIDSAAIEAAVRG